MGIEERTREEHIPSQPSLGVTGVVGAVQGVLAHGLGPCTGQDGSHWLLTGDTGCGRYKVL